MARAPVLRWILTPLVGILGLLIVAVLNRGAEWTVTHRTESVLYADDRAVPMNDQEALRAAFRTAHHVRTDDSTEVTLALGRVVSLDLSPGCTIGCPNTPGRLVDNEINLTLVSGTLRVLQGTDMGSRRLVAFTPEARIEILSPLVSISRTDSTTVVNVYDGESRVGSHTPGPPLTVSSGRSAVIEPGRAPRAAGSIEPGELRILAQLRSRGFR